MTKSKLDTLAVFEMLVAKTDGIEIKGAKSSYCSVNGNMFCFLTAEGKLALRISDQDRKKFLEDHGEQCVCIQYGATMRGYVEVPDSILDNKRKLNSLFKKCCEFGLSLPRKPTTKKQAKSKKASKKIDARQPAKKKAIKKK